MSQRVLVTGATGRTGPLLVDALRSDGNSVRALVRATSTIPPQWDGAVDLAVGDLTDPASVREAMADIDALVLLSPMDPDIDRLERPAIDAARDAHVQHVVKISTTVPDVNSPISWWRAHGRSETYLRDSGLSWTIVRPNGIAFFLLDYADSVRNHGVMRTAAPDGEMALIHPADIAAVVAHVVADPQRYRGETLAISGPQAVSYDDIAAILSRLTERPVRHQPESEAESRARLLALGRPEWEADGLVANFRMTRGNAYGFDRVTGTVQDILGRPPHSVDVFLAEHLARFMPES